MKFKNPITHIAGIAGTLALIAGAGGPLQGQELFVPGFAKAEFYTGIVGVLVDDLRLDPNFPASPESTRYVAGLESPTGFGDNYGVRLSGLITPPANGSYVFYISSDDAGEFWLSTDSNPQNLNLLCNEPAWNGVREWNTPGSNAAGRNVDTPENISLPITLNAGEQYYFEALMKEGGGGDNLAVAVAPENAPIPANGSSPISGSWLGVRVPTAGASIQISQQPAAVSVQANQDATFSVEVTGTSPLGTNIVYEWHRDGVPIPGATGPTLSLERVQAADNGAMFSVYVAVPGATNISTAAALTVTPDVIPPTVLSARATPLFDEVFVEFSEPVAQASATAMANYALSGGATVSGATLVDPTTVRLATSQLAEDTEYTLTINNVTDTFTPGNPVAANTMVTFSSYAWLPGVVLNKFWDTVNTVNALTNLATYPDEPDRVRFEPRFEYPLDGAGEGGANYANSLEAWWTPPETGNYTLFVSGDDLVNLYLSTDDDPANIRLIAQEPQWNNARDWQGTLDPDALTRRPGLENRSDTFVDTEWPEGNTINLQGGQKYYLLALHHEGGGGDNVGVTYSLVGEPEPESGSPPIEGSELGFYYDPSLSELSLDQQPASPTILEGRSATVSVGATGQWQFSDMPFFQWQGAPSGSTTFTNIPGATAGSYLTPVLQTGDSGAQYRVVLSVPGLSMTSQIASVTVQPDQMAPAISRVVAVSSDAINVTFDEPVEAASATNAANFTLSGNLPVSGVLLTSSNVVRIETSGTITSGSDYTLTINGVRDLYGNATANLAQSFTARIVTYADVILADGPVAFYRFEETSGSIAENQGTRGDEADGLWMIADAEGTVKSAPGPRPALGFGGFSGSNLAADFDGIGDWIDTTQRLLDSLTAFSLEYWVNPLRTNEFGEIWMGGGAAGGSPDRVGIVGQNDTVEYGFINPTTIEIWTPNGGLLQSSYPYPDGEWHHIATIADGTAIRNYFDGELVGSGGTPLGAGSTYGSFDFNVHIGGGGITDATGNFFRGQLDEVAIFDKAIPADRIAAHYRAGREGGVIEEEEPAITGITLAGGNVTIEWTGGGTLETAASVTGPWSDVAGASSPHSTPATEAAAFFRVRGN
jgi:hypothetical protein